MEGSSKDITNQIQQQLFDLFLFYYIYFFKFFRPFSVSKNDKQEKKQKKTTQISVERRLKTPGVDLL